MTVTTHGFATYEAEVAAAWQAHLAPREPDAPTVVSLFAGAGGSSLGYSMAGFRELAAVEWDEHAAAMLARNFPGVRVLHGDIAKVDPRSLGLSPGDLDVLDGSPPCQGFSTSGRRQIDDPRNSLFREYVRLLRWLQPRALVMENVSGMVRGQMQAVFAEIHAELRSCGYRVTAALLDASYYRVPQRRLRVVFIGIREDLGVEPGHPMPMSAPLTLRAGLRGLSSPGIVVYPSGSAAKLAPHIRPGKYGKHALKAVGKAPSFFNLHRTRWDQPCATIFKTFGAGITGMLHPDKNRYLSSNELCLAQSWPLAYDWGESAYKDIHARLGNSVPPLLMRAVASHLRTLLPAR